MINIFSKTAITIFVILYIFYTSAVQAEYQTIREQNCSNYTDTVYAVERNSYLCQEYLNPCYFYREQVRRWNNYEHLLSIVRKESCPNKNCPTICTLQFDPICAEHNGKRKTFSNACALGVASCTENKRYTELFKGSCEEETPLCSHDVVGK